MEPILLTLGIGAVWYWLSRTKTYAFESVTGGVTKKPWLTRVVGITGSGDNKKTIVEVWAPAGSWGPHGQILVATYEQTGSDKGTRRSLGIGPEAVPAMVTAAGQDFAIKSPPATTSGIINGAAADDRARIYERGTKKPIGVVHSYLDGNRYTWYASFMNGQPIAQGTGRTPSEARFHAATALNRKYASMKRKAAILRSLS